MACVDTCRIDPCKVLTNLSLGKINGDNARLIELAKEVYSLYFRPSIYMHKLNIAIPNIWLRRDYLYKQINSLFHGFNYNANKDRNFFGTIKDKKTRLITGISSDVNYYYIRGISNYRKGHAEHAFKRCMENINHSSTFESSSININTPFSEAMAGINLTRENIFVCV